MFQSTPPRGRRQAFIRHWRLCRCFNPRLHEGGDSSTPTAFMITSWVSIHASTREATWLLSGKWAEILGFQSTPPRGRRPDGTVPRVFGLVSIHASTREATSLCSRSSEGLFQSRLHEEATRALSVWRGNSVFQSTPPGRRLKPCLSGAGTACFNPRLHEEATLVPSD